jgi:hypothetical protein
LKEESFCDLVRAVWGTQQEAEEAGAQRRLARKISMLKERVKIWLADRKKKELLAFENLEVEITFLTEKIMESDQSYEIRSQLESLENERNKLLLAEEEHWCLKSRATWIKSGDKNTKYFHQFASYRRNKKHLWEVKDESGLAHYGQDAIKIEAQRYFSTFYQESRINTIEDQWHRWDIILGWSTRRKLYI